VILFHGLFVLLQALWWCVAHKVQSLLGIMQTALWHSLPQPLCCKTSKFFSVNLRKASA